jgi:hypothetical protein
MGGRDRDNLLDNNSEEGVHSPHGAGIPVFQRIKKNHENYQLRQSVIRPKL